MKQITNLEELMAALAQLNGLEAKALTEAEGAPDLDEPCTATGGCLGCDEAVEPEGIPMPKLEASKLLINDIIHNTLKAGDIEKVQVETLLLLVELRKRLGRG